LFEFASFRLFTFHLARVGEIGRQMEYPYQDRAKSISERAADLLARMTIEEKIAQMHAFWLILSEDGRQCLLAQMVGLSVSTLRPRWLRRRGQFETRSLTNIAIHEADIADLAVNQSGLTTKIVITGRNHASQAVH
jgi:hypothetical protein